MPLTNNLQLPLSIAVWLATDSYDYNSDPKTISATSLLRSTRQFILGQRAEKQAVDLDIESLLPSQLGTSIHEAINQAWETNYQKALASLGYDADMISRIKVNPDPTTLQENDIPIYMEQRETKEINGYKITGKYDFIGNGHLEDFKSTGTYGYMVQSNVEKYQMQGNIYRWLNPDKITSPTMTIQYIFTDWSKLTYLKQKDKGYPSCRTVAQQLDLWEVDKTQKWIEEKLFQIDEAQNLPESDLPLCTPSECWEHDSIYAYYKNPNASRSTGNFKSYAEALYKQQQCGGQGVIKERKGQVRYCSYCPGLSICSQKDTFIADGRLII